MKNEEEKAYDIARNLRESPQLLMASNGVLGTVLSLLAGLMFSASILFFSFGRGLPYGDLFALSIMVNAVLFVFAALANNMQTHSIISRSLKDYKRWSNAVNFLGNNGILHMMLNLIGMGFYLRWETGAIMSIVVVVGAIYLGHNLKKIRKD